MTTRTENDEIFFNGLTHFPTLPSTPSLFLKGEAIPDVQHVNDLVAAGGTITNFINGAPNHILYILGDGVCVVSNNSNIVTLTGANITLTSGKIYLFKFMSGKWRQMI